MISAIRAKNFGIFPDVNLEFTGDSVKHFIHAINHDIPGAESNMCGKSIFIGIPVFTLFAKLPKPQFKKADIINDQAKDGWTEVEFTQIQGIEGTLRVRRGLKSGLEFWIGDHHVMKGTPTLTQEALYKVLGYSKKQQKTAADDFIRTTKITGNDLDKFATGSPTDNAEFLGRIFGQEIWSYFTTILKKDLADNIAPHILIWESKLSTDVTLESIDNDMINKREQISNSNGVIHDLEIEQTELQKKIATYSVIHDQKTALQNLKDSTATYKTGKQDELNRYKTQIEDKKKLINECNVFIKHQDITIDINEARAIEIENEINTIEKDRTQIQTQITEIQVTVGEVASRLEQNAFFSIPIRQLQKESVQTDQTFARYSEVLRAEDETIDKFTTGEGLSCPSCKTDLTLITGEHPHLKLFDLESERIIIRNNLKQFMEIIAKKRTLVEDRIKLKKQIEKLRVAIKEIQEQEKIIIQIQEQEKTIKRTQMEIMELDNTATMLLTTVRTELAKMEQNITEAETKIANVDASKYITIKEELDKVIYNIKREQKFQEIAQRALGNLDAQKREIQKATEQLEQLYKDRAKIEFFIKWSPIIKNRLVESKIPLLESIANERLADIQAHLYIKLRMSKENAKGETVNKFNPVILRDGEEIPVYRESSGGIRRIAFAILAATLELGAAKKFGYFEIDEALDTLDAAGRMNMTELINAIPLQGFVTAHTSDIQSMFEKKILIERKNNLATARFA